MDGDTLYPTPTIVFHYPEYMPPDPQIYGTGALTTDPDTGERTARVHIQGRQADQVDQIRQTHVQPEGCVGSCFSEWSASWYDIIQRDGKWYIGGVGPLVQENDSTFNFVIEENGNRTVMDTYQLLNGGDVLYVPGGDGIPPDYARLVKP